MSWTVPLTDVRMTEEDLEAVAETLRSGWLTMGPRTKAFEAAIKEATTAAHAVAVSSGTAALHLACAALGLGPGDEVIVPAFTFLATAHAPRYVGATPVLADVVAPECPNLDPGDVERRITPRTKAVIAVHMCGYAADTDRLSELCTQHRLRLIEDAAQAFGARTGAARTPAGTVGALGCLSFFSKKQLAVGEGGMVLTADEALADRARLLRSHAMTAGTWDRHHGHEDSYDIVDVGFNFRLDEPRAALGLSRLKRVAAGIEERRATVRTYRERLGPLDGLTLMWDDEAVERGSHFAFPILFDSGSARARAADVIADRGVQTTRYPVLHELTEYASYAAIGSLPNAEAAADRHLALPLSAGMSDEQVGLVVDAVRAALR
jgi:dTDP-4-amino-4,6-dideoxygalactose transaminase